MAINYAQRVSFLFQPRKYWFSSLSTHWFFKTVSLGLILSPSSPRLSFLSAKIDYRCVPPRTAYDFYVFILFFFDDKDQVLGLTHASWVGALPAQLHPSPQQLIFRDVIAVHSDKGDFMDLLQGSLSLLSSSPAPPSLTSFPSSPLSFPAPFWGFQWFTENLVTEM